MAKSRSDSLHHRDLEPARRAKKPRNITDSGEAPCDRSRSGRDEWVELDGDWHFQNAWAQIDHKSHKIAEEWPAFHIWEIQGQDDKLNDTEVLRDKPQSQRQWN